MSTPETRFRQGQQLVANQRYDSPDFTRGLELLREAGAAGHAEAQFALGQVYSQIHLLPDARQQAAHWYGQAAGQGHPMAMDRLADLHLLGYGVPRDDRKAFAWFERVAAQCHPHALCTLAYLHDAALGTEFDPVAATGCYLTAAAQADPRGLFNLGLHYSEGRGVARHPEAALACLSLAAFANYPLAQELAEQHRARLDAASCKRAANLELRLRERLRAFQTYLETHPDPVSNPAALLDFAHSNLAQLGEPVFSHDPAMRAQTGEIRPSNPHQPSAPKMLSTTPRIFTIESFISNSERAQILALAAQDMQPAARVRDRISREHVAFTGSLATFALPGYDVVMRNVERRIASAFNLPVAHVEPLSVLRYGMQDHYAPHVDYFDSARLAHNQAIGDLSGQRIASFLVCLNAPQQGGETHYLKLGLKVAGRANMALCHFNLTPTGDTDAATLHTGEPVLAGEKWLARTTLREAPLY
ncbi:MAG TPA: 2OG-Fe(II) oxygenase [Gammaproteobacteria bacterium]|nr:2OG-Fe(II) oxygenase [Gammaproteobacteria bacterium]